MKRGSTDVDWVIAVGLFIVFLLSIFVFLKPGITSPHRPEALLDIIEDGIKQESFLDGPGIYWTINELPLYIENIDITSIKCIKVPFTYGWSKSDFDIYKITGDDNDLNNLPDPNKENPIPFYIDGNNIVLKTALVNPKDVFSLVRSKNNDVFSKRNIESGSISLESDCALEIIEPTEVIAGDEKIHFEYSYGVIESTRGISEYAINSYESQADIDINLYNSLKNNYGFPSSKEFSVHLKTDTITIDFQPIPPEVDANIFVREWSDFILNYNGLRTPVNVNIRTW